MDVKIITGKNTPIGRMVVENQLQTFAKEGWQYSDQSTAGGGYGAVKTIALGALFLPLALKGKNPNQITITLVRPREIGIAKTAEAKALRLERKAIRKEKRSMLFNRLLHKA